MRLKDKRAGVRSFHVALTVSEDGADSIPDNIHGAKLDSVGGFASPWSLLSPGWPGFLSTGLTLSISIDISS